jgi:precorrin-6A/cobalt-precorrin-6A reductase
VILLLGGTSEARELAVLLQDAGIRFVSSLAGRVARPRLPVGAVQIGGFGGAAGLQAHLMEHRVDAVVDATHPFAEGMTRNAVAACAALRIPLLRLERPGWTEPAGAGWTWVGDHDEAAVAAAELGKRPFLTVGRQSLDRFVGPLADRPTLVRVVDAPEVEVPAPWIVLLSRGPYPVESERALFAEHGIDVVVTKDSGGSYTRAKLQVAAETGASVVIVRRLTAPADVPVVTDALSAADWVTATVARH